MRIISNSDGNCNSTISFLFGGVLLIVSAWQNRILTFGLNLFPTFVVYFCVSFVSMYRPSQMKPRLHFSVASFVVWWFDGKFSFETLNVRRFLYHFLIVISYSFFFLISCWCWRFHFTFPSSPPLSLTLIDRLNNFPHWIIADVYYVLNAFNRFNSSIEFNPMGEMEWEPFELGAPFGSDDY